MSSGDARPAEVGVIFILSTPRAGSTMMRYVLGAHRDVLCPDEIQLGAYCLAALNVEQGLAAYERSSEPEHTIRLGLGLATEERGIRHTSATDAMLAGVRRSVSGRLDEVTLGQHKRAWCEKSPMNCDYAWLLARVFPDARFICLHRHCLDVVMSCIEMMQYGTWPGFADYVRARPKNYLEAYASGWLEMTDAILDFEQEHRERCFRVSYEEYLRAPVERTAEILSFCGLDADPDLTNRAFRVRHPQRVARGDPKAQYATRVDVARAQKPLTSAVVEGVSRSRLCAAIDATLRRAGLKCIEDRASESARGVEPAPRPGTAPSASQSGASPEQDTSRFVERLVEQLRSILAEPVTVRPGTGVLGLDLVDVANGKWIVDFVHGTISNDGGAQASCTVRTTTRTLESVLAGATDPAAAISSGELALIGEQELEMAATVLRLLLVRNAPATTG